MSVVIDGSNGVDIGAGNLTFPNNTTQTTTGQPTLMTAVASTSGTSIDFTDIPSWAKRITVMFSGVSGSGTSSYLMQLGDSGGIEITGYISTTITAGGANNVVSATATNGFVSYNNASANTHFGSYTITNLTGNTWVISGVLGLGNAAYVVIATGTKTLSDVLTQLRITTVNGTDTFDAGTINVMYE